MALPQALFEKSKGDGLTASDWNAGFKEVARLDGAKINKDGDTLAGPLTVGGRLTVDALTVRSSLSVTGADATTLGMVALPVGPFTLPTRSDAGMLRVEQYPVGSVPPGLPAFLRFSQISTAEPLDTRIDWVTQVSLAGKLYVARHLRVSRPTPFDGPVTFSGVVFAAPVTDGFKPTFELIPA